MCSDGDKEDATDNIRRIHTCLPHTTLKTTPPQDARLFTSLRNKPCPTLLKPWTDFPVLQQQLFERYYEHILQGAELIR
ncbi:hypothetical protein B0O99DRAFT_646494 [Bisporella sp. PMI_857]|nr:hypothetical protein B0O99DRAFT_646494 [Bisporella sp. PMI_857]